MYKVLIVDDEPRVVEFLCHLVDWHSLGFEIFATAYSGKQAVSIIDNNEISVVFFDVMMAGMTGVELSKYIHDNHSEMRMVALSSYDDFDYVREILVNGASDYILKHRITEDGLSSLLSDLYMKLEEDYSKSILPVKSKLKLKKAIVFFDREGINTILHECLSNIQAESDKRFLIVTELVSILQSFPDYLEYEESVAKCKAVLQNKAINGDWDGFIQEFIQAVSSCAIIDVTMVTYPYSVRKALDFIECSYGFNIKLDDCAKVIGINSAYLSRTFHQTLRLTFIEKLNRVRIRKAKEMILRDLSLKETAYACGFKNYNYFFKVFKKVTGITPIQYQESRIGKE